MRDLRIVEIEEAFDHQIRTEAFWNEFMPDWEQRLEENDFATGYDWTVEFNEIFG